MKEKSVWQLLIDFLQSALDAPGTGKILNRKFDVKGLRKKLHLTQHVFSVRYHINLKTLRKWEQGDRSPDME